MAEQQQLTPKQHLAALIRSFAAATESKDPILLDFATRNLDSFLGRIDLSLIDTSLIDGDTANSEEG